ncbi:MAG: spore coat associated protein CotJA [Anaerovoracaceae bacterium]
MNCNQTSMRGGYRYMNNYCCGNVVQNTACCEYPGAPIPRDCEFETWPPAMAYVPMQPWEETYDMQTGLSAGTIFPSLDLPFTGGGAG